MTKPEGLSAEAAAASTEDELWGLFMTDEILDNIVRYTNDSIQEDMEQLQYSAERMNQSPYIKPIDKVTFFPPHFLSHSHATLPFVEGPVPPQTCLHLSSPLIPISSTPHTVLTPAFLFLGQSHNLLRWVMAFWLN
jgi:hypothetical protein